MTEMTERDSHEPSAPGIVWDREVLICFSMIARRAMCPITARTM